MWFLRRRHPPSALHAKVKGLCKVIAIAADGVTAVLLKCAIDFKKASVVSTHVLQFGKYPHFLTTLWACGVALYGHVGLVAVWLSLLRRRSSAACVVVFYHSH